MIHSLPPPVSATTRCALALCTLFSCPVIAHAASGLVMHLKLDENPASNGMVLVDASGNGNNATAINNNGSANKSVPGINGNALRFDGGVDRVDATAFDIEDSFTVALWLNPNTTDRQAFVGKHDSAGGNQFVLGFYGGGYHVSIQGTTHEAGSPTTGWQHIAVAAEATGTGSTTVILYRDAIPLWTNTIPAVMGNVAGGRAWTFGQEWDSGPTASDYFDGAMDDVAIWNGALSADEIDHLVNGSTINVTTTTDVVDSEDGFTSLREAVIEANQRLGPNTIELPSGPFRLNLTGADEDASASGDLDVTDTFGTLTIQGSIENETIIHGNYTDRILHLIPHTDVFLKDLTLRSGVAPGNGGGVFAEARNGLRGERLHFLENRANGGNGGGLFSGAFNRVALVDVDFEENRTSLSGGGYVERGAGLVQNVRFLANHADNSGGGAAGDALGNMSVYNAVFVGNTAAGFGGALSIADSTECSLVNATMVENVAANGGAVWNGVDILLRNSILWGNQDFASAPSQIGGNPLSGASGPNLIEGEPGARTPLFVRLPDSGDDDWTTSADNDFGDLHQTVSSPGLNVGNSHLLPADLLTDLDGAPRIRQGIVDLGAYEAQLIGQYRVDQSAPGLEENGLTWETAFTSIHAALAIAEAGDELWLKADTYKPAGPGADPEAATSSFILKEDVDIYGGFAGTEPQRDQRDPIANITTLSGDLNGDDAPNMYSDNSQHVLRATGLTTETLLDGITITAGNGLGKSNPRGAGLYSVNGAPRLSNVIFLRNETTYGGAIYVENSNLVLEDVQFNRNYGYQGGGIFHSGPGLFRGTRVRFWQCRAESSRITPQAFLAYGGGIYTAGVVDLVDCEFDDNRASYGGGVYLNLDSPEQRIVSSLFEDNLSIVQGGGLITVGRATLIDATFTGNTAPQGGGTLHYGGDVHMIRPVFDNNTTLDIGSASRNGGAILFAGDTLRVDHGHFENNDAISSGGAIYTGNGTDAVVIGSRFVRNGYTPAGGTASGFLQGGAINARGDLTVINCVFDRQRARYGGALSLIGASSTIIGSVFSGNQADWSGATIQFLGDSCVLRNVTMAGNNATIEEGGAVRLQDGHLDIANSIIVANRDSNLGDFRNDSTYVVGTGTTAIANSIVRGYPSSGVSWPSSVATDGGGNSNGSPTLYKLVQPQTNPSDPSDVRLMTGSAGIDIGGNTHLPPDTYDLDNDLDTTEPMPVDLTGAPRVIGGTVDMGAYEGGYTTFAATHPGLDPDLDDNNNGFTNFEDYTLGNDPESLTAPVDSLELNLEGGLPVVRHTIRGNGADTVPVRVFMSSNLTFWFPFNSTEPVDVETVWPAGDLSLRQIIYRYRFFNRELTFYKLGFDSGP
ncbi:MAG TPA: hypothetical protein DCY13_12590 [Verrucomicrobiales bacterium]|nr:hypothetical protein [Verrucomicrobiales bacterium]